METEKSETEKTIGDGNIWQPILLLLITSVIITAGIAPGQIWNSLQPDTRPVNPESWLFATIVFLLFVVFLAFLAFAMAAFCWAFCRAMDLVLGLFDR